MRILLVILQHLKYVAIYIYIYMYTYCPLCCLHNPIGSSGGSACWACCACACSLTVLVVLAVLFLIGRSPGNWQRGQRQNILTSACRKITKYTNQLNKRKTTLVSKFPVANPMSHTELQQIPHTAADVLAPLPLNHEQGTIASRVRRCPSHPRWLV